MLNTTTISRIIYFCTHFIIIFQNTVYACVIVLISGIAVFEITGHITGAMNCLTVKHNAKPRLTGCRI